MSEFAHAKQGFPSADAVAGHPIHPKLKLPDAPTFAIANAFIETLQGDRTDDVKALIAARIRRFFGEDAVIDQAHANGGVRVTLSALRPLFDERLLREMVATCSRTPIRPS